MTLDEVKQIVAEKHGYPNYLAGIFERNKPTCRYTVTELVNDVAELYAESKVKNISSNPMLDDVLLEQSNWLMANSSLEVEKIVDLKMHLQKHFI